MENRSAVANSKDINESATSSQIHTLLDGPTVEVMVKGKADRKVASPGEQVLQFENSDTDGANVMLLNDPFFCPDQNSFHRQIKRYRMHCWLNHWCSSSSILSRCLSLLSNTITARFEKVLKGLSIGIEGGHFGD
uniref:Putative ovule protein n=1 Tax=Solanum chacoense TaxID=4108 RepID=A0A0V0IBM6_SOLCH